MNEQHSAGSTETYCVCGKSQSARRQDGSLYCSGCGKDYHPDNFTDLCEDCDERPITGLDARCDACRENANERAYDRSMEEPTYRGGEYASALAEEQARIQRELK